MIIDFAKRFYRNQKRMIDKETIWDHLCDFCEDVAAARRAFRLHMDLDDSTYGDMSEAEKQAYVETFKWRE